jgi:type I restriction enzyme S subunit
VWHLTLDQIESGTGRIVDKQIAPASAAGSSTYVFDSGNVLYSKLRPYLNKVVRPAEAGIATTQLVPLRPQPRVLCPEFLAYYLRSPRFVAFASGCVAGAKMPRVITAKLWQHEVPVPPLQGARMLTVPLLCQCAVANDTGGTRGAWVSVAAMTKVARDPFTVLPRSGIL